MKIPFEGGCACGEVRYKCEAEPIAMLKCHCRDCQKVSGAPHVCAVLIPRSSFSITKGILKYHFTSSEGGGLHKRGFCPECGSRLTGGEDRNSSTDFVGVTAGSLDDPGWFNPGMELWTCDALPWDPPSAGVPAFDKSPS